MFLAHEPHAVEYQQGMQQICLRTQYGVGLMCGCRIVLAGLVHAMVCRADDHTHMWISGDALGQVEQGLCRRLAEISVCTVAGDLACIKKGREQRCRFHGRSGGYHSPYYAEDKL